MSAPKDVESVMDPITVAVNAIFAEAKLLSDELTKSFQNELDALHKERTLLLSESRKSRLKFGKRKLKSICEEEDADAANKKNRPSNEVTQNHTFVVPNNGNTSTPNEKNSILNEDAVKPEDEKVTNVQIPSQPKTRRTTRATVNKTTAEEPSDNLMPPPVMPPPAMPPPVIIKKKRATRATKASKFAKDESDNDKSVSDQNESVSRQKTPDSSVIEEPTGKRRMGTRSQTRNTTMDIGNESQISNVSITQPKKNTRRTRKTKLDKDTDSDTTSVENNTIQNNKDNTQNATQILDMTKSPKNNQTKKRNKNTPNQTTTIEVRENNQETVTDSTKTQCNMDMEVSTDVEMSKINHKIDDTTTSTKSMENKIDESIEIVSVEKQTDLNTTKTISDNNVAKTEDIQSEKPSNKFDETIVLKAAAAKQCSASTIASDSKDTPSDTTITLPTNSNKLLNETITINKDNQVLYNPSHSLLPDDLSEIDETPSNKKTMSKIIKDVTLKKVVPVFESPVKSAVKHFEKLAESSKSNIPKANNLKMAGSVKDKNQVVRVPPKIIVTNTKIIDSKKNTPLNKNGFQKTMIPGSASKQKKAIQEAKELEEKRKHEEIKKARLIELKEAAKLAHQQKINAEAEKNKKNMVIKEYNKENEMKLNAAKNMTVVKKYDFDMMIREDEELENESDEKKEKSKNIRKPPWARSETLDRIIKTQHHITTSEIDRFFKCRESDLNLGDVFPNIDIKKLRRGSSAMWKVPPRCSLMPHGYK